MLCYQWLQTNKTKICCQIKLRHNSEPLVAFWQIVICERAGRERAWDAKRKVLLQVLFISSFSVLWSVLWSACEMMDGQETGRRQWSASGLLQTTGAFKLKKKAYYPDRIWTSTSFLVKGGVGGGRKRERLSLLSLETVGDIFVQSGFIWSVVPKDYWQPNRKMDISRTLHATKLKNIYTNETKGTINK